MSRGQSRARGSEERADSPLRGQGGRNGPCAPMYHTRWDSDALGELNVTLTIDSKKNYKWFIKKGLLSSNC